MILLVSYFEIGGKVVECLIDQPDATQPDFFKPMDELAFMAVDVGLGQTAKQVAKATGKEDYSAMRASRGVSKVRGGGTAISTGGNIARWALVAAAADGPLPVGDIIAAGILIGGGLYFVHEGWQDIRQE